MKDGPARATNAELAGLRNPIGIRAFRSIQPHPARFSPVYKTAKNSRANPSVAADRMSLFPVKKYHGDIII
jgi:hypothetical protein